MSDHDCVIRYPSAESLKLDNWTTREYHLFLQKMANRRIVGALRYEDKPTPFKRYLTRLKKEVAKYERSGNIEHLINVANFAFLESVAPENGKNSFDPTVESVTRTEMRYFRKRKA